MKKSLGFVCVMLFCISCSQDLDSSAASEQDAEIAEIEDEEVQANPDNAQAVLDPVEETAAPHTEPAPPPPTSNAATSNERPPEDPFGDPFAFGTGSGNRGNGSGSGEGLSNVSKIKRTQLTELDRSAFQIKESASIRLLLSIDASGSVLAASVDKRYTTTRDEELLNKVIEAVKKQVKYNRVLGTPIMKVEYKVFIEGTEIPVYVR